MRISITVVLVALVLAVAPAQADSWLPPRPKRVPSEDGRWYVIVQPTDVYKDPHFILVRRAAGKPPPPQPADYDALMEPARLLAPEAGDEVVARGPCKIPMRVKCLDGGKGFLLFDTYGRKGYGTVLEVYDGKGEQRWTKTLADLFDARTREAFRRSVSSIWWSETIWVDEEAQDIVIVWRAGGAPQVLRVALADGKHREGAPTDLLGRIGRGSGGEQVEALDLAGKIGLEGLLPAVQKAFADSATPPLARVHFAKYLHDAGDISGRNYFLAAAQPGMPGEVRAFAVRFLGTLFRDEALPTLRAAMDADENLVRYRAEEALRGMGPQAVPMLIEMVEDETASERSRAGAATALWNMRVEHTLPAKAALEKAAKSKLHKLAYAAGHALEQILEYEK